MPAVKSDPDFSVSDLEQHPHYLQYSDNSNGIEFYRVPYNQLYSNGFRDASTPYSNRSSSGVRTRSGRSTKRADSPLSTTKSRVSKSPAPPRRDRKSKIDKSKVPKLTAPLSVLTKDMNVPVKDINEWVNRSTETRKQEAAKRNGYVTRPMNSFMLYRSAYADRTKQWCLKNNHQVVSSVSGESWPMEPQEVRDQFNEWAKIERLNHSRAHPNYKFSPSKANNKKRKNDDSEDDEGSLDLGDMDGEYKGPRNSRARKQETADQAYIGQAYTTSPYYDAQSAYDVAQYTGNHIHPLPSNAMLESYPLHSSAPATHYQQLAVQAPQHFTFAPDMHESIASPTSLGGYGLPNGQLDESFLMGRDGTPFQPFNQHGQQIYAFAPRMAVATAPNSQSMLDGQQYFQPSLLGHHTVDPGLDADLTEGVTALHDYDENAHFNDAMGDLGQEYAYAEHPSNINSTLAPHWSADAAE